MTQSLPVQMHPRYAEFLQFVGVIKSDARKNVNALNLAFDVWLKYQELGECFVDRPPHKTEFLNENMILKAEIDAQKSMNAALRESNQELKKDLDRKHRECAERERQCALQAEYILELESLVENKADNDKTVKDYALWQAITDLEMFCRHRSAGQLQIESEDRKSTPIIENALILLKALKVDIEQNPNFPNIKINYDRDDNPFFGKSGK